MDAVKALTNLRRLALYARSKKKPASRSHLFAKCTPNLQIQKLKTVSFWLVSADKTGVTLDEESSASGWFTIDEALQLPLYPGTKSFFEMVKRGEVELEG